MAGMGITPAGSPWWGQKGQWLTTGCLQRHILLWRSVLAGLSSPGAFWREQWWCLAHFCACLGWRGEQSNQGCCKDEGDFQCCSQIKECEEEPVQGWGLGERLLWQEPVKPALCGICQSTAKVKARAEFTVSKLLPAKHPGAHFWPCSSSATEGLLPVPVTGESLLPSLHWSSGWGNQVLPGSWPLWSRQGHGTELPGRVSPQPWAPGTQGWKIRLCVPAGRQSPSCQAAAETQSLLLSCDCPSRL